MKRKQAPYIVIAVLCLIMGVARSTIISEWAWYLHLLVSIFQFLLFSGIWNLVLWINREIKKRFDYIQTPVRTIFFQVFLSLVLVSPIFILSFYLAKPYLPSFVNRQFLTLLYVLAFFVLLMINFGFFAHLFFKDLQKSLEEKATLQLEAEKLSKEKMMMQYHHLKNQVNPHFLFNALTSLDGLIHTNPQLASDFLKHLSKVYRYVLEHKEQEVVRIETELAFIAHYIELLKIRFSNSLQFHIAVSKEAKDRGIVMVTLQMLIDNALKHNGLSKAKPLHIYIKDAEGFLVVRNNKQARKQLEVSTQQGLQQLEELYRYLNDNKITILNTEDFFEVKLPLL
jgi:two-component system LytT family sensor kinase